MRDSVSDHLWLARCRGVGPATYRKLLKRYGSAKEVRALAEAGMTRLKPADLPHPDAISAEMARARECGARALVLGHGRYPPSLADIADAPPVIWARGNFDVLEQPAIAIVGARNSSALGHRIAGQFAQDLGVAGCVTVSGLARGIDTQVHHASLETGTIAVLAGGVDHIYPEENAELAGAILETGLLLSEASMGTVPQARHFPRRNRLISGLSRAVVLIEAAEKSGSLITARFALDQGREVMAVPGNPLDGRAAGCNALIRDGAHLVRSGADILEALEAPVMPRQRPLALHEPAAEFKSPPQRQTLDSLLGAAPISEDDLIRAAGQPAQAVLRELAQLDLQGRLMRHPGGMVSLALP